MVKRFSAKRLLSMVMALAITVLSFPVGFNVLDGQTDPLVAAQGVRGSSVGPFRDVSHTLTLDEGHEEECKRQMTGAVEFTWPEKGTYIDFVIVQDTSQSFEGNFTYVKNTLNKMIDELNMGTDEHNYPKDRVMTVAFSGNNGLIEGQNSSSQVANRGYPPLVLTPGGFYLTKEEAKTAVNSFEQSHATPTIDALALAKSHYNSLTNGGEVYNKSVYEVGDRVHRRKTVYFLLTDGVANSAKYDNLLTKPDTAIFGDPTSQSGYTASSSYGWVDNSQNLDYIRQLWDRYGQGSSADSVKVTINNKNFYVLNPNSSQYRDTLFVGVRSPLNQVRPEARIEFDLMLTNIKQYGELLKSSGGLVESGGIGGRAHMLTAFWEDIASFRELDNLGPWYENPFTINGVAQEPIRTQSLQTLQTMASDEQSFVLGTSDDSGMSQFARDLTAALRRIADAVVDNVSIALAEGYVANTDQIVIEKLSDDGETVLETMPVSPGSELSDTHMMINMAAMSKGRYRIKYKVTETAFFKDANVPADISFDFEGINYPLDAPEFNPSIPGNPRTDCEFDILKEVSSDSSTNREEEKFLRELTEGFTFYNTFKLNRAVQDVKEDEQIILEDPLDPDVVYQEGTATAKNLDTQATYDVNYDSQAHKLIIILPPNEGAGYPYGGYQNQTIELRFKGTLNSETITPERLEEILGLNELGEPIGVPNQSNIRYGKEGAWKTKPSNPVKVVPPPPNPPIEKKVNDVKELTLTKDQMSYPLIYTVKTQLPAVVEDYTSFTISDEIPHVLVYQSAYVTVDGGTDVDKKIVVAYDPGEREVTAKLTGTDDIRLYAGKTLILTINTIIDQTKDLNQYLVEGAIPNTASIQVNDKPKIEDTAKIKPRKTGFSLQKHLEDEETTWPEGQQAIFKLERQLGEGWIVVEPEITINSFDPVEFSDLLPGTYRLTEVSAPAGYIKSGDTVFDLNGDEIGIFKVLIINTKTPVPIKTVDQSYFEDFEATREFIVSVPVGPVFGITSFIVEDPIDSFLKVTEVQTLVDDGQTEAPIDGIAAVIEDNTVRLVVTDPENLAKIDNKTVNMIIKVQLKDGFVYADLPDEYKTNGIPNQAGLFINNKPKVSTWEKRVQVPVGEITLVKTYEGNALPDDKNVLFKLYRVVGDKDFESGEENDVLVNSYWTQKNEENQDVIHVTDLQPGTYYFIESTTPVEFAPDLTPQVFTIAVDAGGETVTTTTTGEGTFADFTVDNEPIDVPVPEKEVKEVGGDYDPEHVDLSAFDATFNYKVEVPIGKVDGWTEFTLTDPVDPQLNVSNIKVDIKNNETVLKTYTLDNLNDADLFTHNAESNLITFQFTELEKIKMLAGKVVVLTFDATIKDKAAFIAAHPDLVVGNEAKLDIGNQSKPSNKVTVVPPPEPDKKVNGEDEVTVNKTQLEEPFVYTVETTLPGVVSNYETFTITDKLDRLLIYESASITVDGGEDVDGKFVVECDEESRLVVAKLTSPEDIALYAGKNIVLTINTRIDPTKDLKDYLEKGVLPNTASIQVNDHPKINDTAKVTPMRGSFNLYKKLEGETTTWPEGQQAVFKLERKVGETWVVERSEIVVESFDPIEISNLLPGEFKLTELSSPDGYVPAGDQMFSLSGDEQQTVEIIVNNTKTPVPVKTVDQNFFETFDATRTFTISVPVGPVDGISSFNIEDAIDSYFKVIDIQTLVDNESVEGIAATMDGSVLKLSVEGEDLAKIADKTVNIVYQVNLKDGFSYADLPEDYKTSGIPNQAGLIVDNQPRVNTAIKKVEVPVGEVTLRKTAQGQALAENESATFELYRVIGEKDFISQNEEDTADALVGTYMTRKQGGQDVVHVDQLQPGTYYFIETAAPNGYITDGTPQVFVITVNAGETPVTTQTTGEGSFANFTVDNQPIETPPVEKDVKETGAFQKSHLNLSAADATFSYKVEVPIEQTAGWTEFTLTDPVDNTLAVTDVKVEILSGSDVEKTYTLEETDDADVFTLGEDNLIIFQFTELSKVQSLMNKTVVLTFNAEIKDMAAYLEAHPNAVVENEAKVDIGNGAEPSNKVTVSPPPEDPPLEKKVNGVKEATLTKAQLEEPLVYTVETTLPSHTNSYETFTISDPLDPVLIFESAYVTVDDGQDEDGKIIVAYDDQQRVVTAKLFSAADIALYAGKKIVLTIDARIDETKDLKDYLVEGALPNTASIIINNEPKVHDSAKVKPMEAAFNLIKKLEGESENWPAGEKAIFRLQRKVNGQWVVEQSEIEVTDFEAVNITGLLPGEYLLSEVSAPAGYIKSGDHAFELNGNEAATVEVEIVNTKTPVPVKTIDQNYFADFSETRQFIVSVPVGPVTGITTFKVEDPIDSYFKVSDLQTFVDNERIEGIEATLDGAVVRLTVEGDDLSKIENKTINIIFNVNLKDGFTYADLPDEYKASGIPNTASLIIDNKPKIDTETKKVQVPVGQVTLTKTASGTALADNQTAAFDLYRVVGAKDFASSEDNDELIGNYETQKNESSQDVITVTELQPGTYYFIETRAPEGFKTDKDPKVFVISIEAGKDPVTTVTHGEGTFSDLTVDNKPLEAPPIEKEVKESGAFQKEHLDLSGFNATFSYKVEVPIKDTSDWTEFTLMDPVDPELNVSNVKVEIKSDSSTEKTYTLESPGDADLFTLDDANVITFQFAQAEKLENLANKTVVLTFDAEINNEISYLTAHPDYIVDNQANINIGNGATPSNKVTVSPPPKDPPIEKKVNGEDEVQLDKEQLNQTLVYTIKTTVPTNTRTYENFTISDPLDEILIYESASVLVDGSEDSAGKIAVNYDADSHVVTAQLNTAADVAMYAGKKITLTIHAKIDQTKDLKDYLVEGALPNTAGILVNNIPKVEDSAKVMPKEAAFNLIKKLDGENTTWPQGEKAVFKLERKVNGTWIVELADIEVSSFEPVSVTGLLPGEYKLTETAAPEGYILAGEQIFSLSGGEVETLEIVVLNSKTPVPVKTVDQTYFENFAASREFTISVPVGSVAGMSTFRIEDSIDPYFQVTDIQTLVDTEEVEGIQAELDGSLLTLNIEGDDLAKIANSTVNIIYSVTLKDEFKYEDLPADYKVEGIPNQAGLIIDNRPRVNTEIKKVEVPVGEVEFIKTASGKPLADGQTASFKLYRVVGERDDLTTDQDDAEDVYVDTYTTSKDQGLDRIHVTNLQPGTYYFIESAAPQGYVLDKTPHVFTIVVDASTTPVTTNTTGEGVFANWLVDNDPIENPPIEKEVKETGAFQKDHLNLSAMEATFHYKVEVPVSEVDGWTEFTLIDPVDQTLEVTNVKVEIRSGSTVENTYTLEEIDDADVFTLDDQNTITFQLTESNKVQSLLNKTVVLTFDAVIQDQAAFIAAHSDLIVDNEATINIGNGAQPSNKVTVSPPPEDPTPEKKVNGEDEVTLNKDQLEQPLTYTVKATLPQNVQTYDTFTISDTLAPILIYNGASVTVDDGPDTDGKIVVAYDSDAREVTAKLVSQTDIALYGGKTILLTIDAKIDQTKDLKDYLVDGALPNTASIQVNDHPKVNDTAKVKPKYAAINLYKKLADEETTWPENEKAIFKLERKVNDKWIVEKSQIVVTGFEEITITGLLPGQYRLTELQAPAGYLKTGDQVFTLSGDQNKAMNITVVNTKSPTPVKTVDQDYFETFDATRTFNISVPVGSIADMTSLKLEDRIDPYFKVTSINTFVGGKTVEGIEAVLENDLLSLTVTGTDLAKIANQIININYTVKLKDDFVYTDLPEDYKTEGIPNQAGLIVNNNPKIETEIKRIEVPVGDITLIKTADGKPLPKGLSATFDLYRVVGAKDFASSEADDILVGEYKTVKTADDQDVITVKNLAPGTYYFVETKAPQDFNKHELPQVFTITVDAGSRPIQTRTTGQSSFTDFTVDNKSTDIPTPQKEVKEYPGDYVSEHLDLTGLNATFNYKVEVPVDRVDGWTEFTLEDPVDQTLDVSNVKVQILSGDTVVTTYTLDAVGDADQFTHDPDSNVITFKLTDQNKISPLAQKTVVLTFDASIRDAEAFLKAHPDRIVDNEASINVGNYSKPSNKVTVSPPPETPAPIKTIDGDDQLSARSHALQLGAWDQMFTYDINVAVPENTHHYKSFVLEDVLERVLVTTKHDVKVYVDDTAVTELQQFIAIEEGDGIHGQTIRFAIDNEQLIQPFDFAALAGKNVRLEIKAHFKDGLSEDELAPYVAEQGVEVPNDAVLKINNHPKLSNTVKVTPPGDEPTVKKSVENADSGPTDHLLLKQKDEVFTFKIDVAVPARVDGYKSIVIEDTLDKALQTSADDVSVIISSESTDPIDADDLGRIRVRGQKVKFEIKDGFERVAGKTITLVIKAKIKDNVGVEDIAANYEQSMIPNDATLIFNGKPKTSNRVTVTPPGNVPAPVKKVGATPYDMNDYLFLEALDKVYFYDITVPVTNNYGYNSFVIHDTVDELLTIIPDSGVISGIHDITGEITIAGRTITYTASSADIAKMNDAVTLRFQARLREDITVAEIERALADDENGIPNTAQLVVNDNPEKYSNTVYVKPGLGSVRLIKTVDKGQPLPADRTATFELYRLDGRNRVLVGEYTTINGEINVKGLTFGRYEWHEKRAPQGYVTAGDVKFTLSSKQKHLDVTVDNKREPGNKWWVPRTGEDMDKLMVGMAMLALVGVLIALRKLIKGLQDDKA